MKNEILKRYVKLQRKKLIVIPNILRFSKNECKKENRNVLLVTGSDPQKTQSGQFVCCRS